VALIFITYVVVAQSAPDGARSARRRGQTRVAKAG
jgi:hypothetical protein